MDIQGPRKDRGGRWGIGNGELGGDYHRPSRLHFVSRNQVGTTARVREVGCLSGGAGHPVTSSGAGHKVLGNLSPDTRPLDSMLSPPFPNSTLPTREKQRAQLKTAKSDEGNILVATVAAGSSLHRANLESLANALPLPHLLPAPNRHRSW